MIKYSICGDYAVLVTPEGSLPGNPEITVDRAGLCRLKLFRTDDGRVAEVTSDNGHFRVEGGYMTPGSTYVPKFIFTEEGKTVDGTAFTLLKTGEKDGVIVRKQGMSGVEIARLWRAVEGIRALACAAARKADEACERVAGFADGYITE